ncbi:MAG: hypothetical protein LBF95_00685 [Treponema sp.]|jgi:hypothetical protein|nr:hypothetical protein [Treponema sp.]
MRNHVWIVLCLAFSLGLGAQEGAGPELPRQFRGLSLGMGLEELKAALAADVLFSFRGDRDVSFLPNPQQNLVETTGLSFVKRAFFQLDKGALFIMAFTMNTDLVDYYSLFTALSEKYGPPGSLSPRQSVWENGSTRLALERPLTVKYIDLGVFNGLVEDSTVQETYELRLRQEFIDAF